MISTWKAEFQENMASVFQKKGATEKDPVDIKELYAQIVQLKVENDRRALNVLHGMRREKKEGRWMGGAPMGYVNRTRADGRKYVAPKVAEAGIMQWVLRNIAEVFLDTEQV